MAAVTINPGDELAYQFLRANADDRVSIMRAALLLDPNDIGPICAAAGIRSHVQCMAIWISVRCPEAIAFRAQYFPNAPTDVPEIYI